MSTARGLKSITDAALRLAIGNRALNLGVMADEAGTAQVNVTTAFEYCVAGKTYSATGAKDLVPRKDTGEYPVDAQAAGTTFYYLCAANAAGNVWIFKSPTASTLPELPDRVQNSAGAWSDVDLAPLVLAKVVTAGAATFTAGTTNTNATNVTITYQAIAAIPLTV